MTETEPFLGKWQISGEYKIRSGDLGVRQGLFIPAIWKGRKNLGLTQVALADNARVKHSVLNLVETGRLLPEVNDRKSLADTVRGTTGFEYDELPNPAIKPVMGNCDMPSQMRFMCTAREIRRMFPPEGREAWVDHIPIFVADSPRVIINDAVKAIREKDFTEAATLLEIAENRLYNSYKGKLRGEMVAWAKDLSLDLDENLIKNAKKRKKVGNLRKVFQLNEELKQAQAQEPDRDQIFE